MSAITTWSFPTRILFGTGAAGKVGAEAARLGATRALLVTDKGVVKAGLVQPVVHALAAAGISAAVFDEVLGNPVEKNVHDGVAAFREAKADLVVAVGGGSPLDVGKLDPARASTTTGRSSTTTTPPAAISSSPGTCPR